MSKKRVYSESYVDYEFSFLVKNGIQLPQCVIYLKTLPNGCMKPYQFRQHLTNAHPEHKDKVRHFFELKLAGVKRAKLDACGTFQQSTKAIVHASYVVSLHVAKAKKPHTIGEVLIKPCMIDCARLVLGEDASRKLKQISLSDDTIKSRIDDMADNIKAQVISKIRLSAFFAIQLDESTDVSNLSQLLVFANYVSDTGVEEEFLFCRPLETTTKAEDAMAKVESFFEESQLNWDNLVGVCTDDAPAMLGGVRDSSPL